MNSEQISEDVNQLTYDQKYNSTKRTIEQIANMLSLRSSNMVVIGHSS